ncbi:glucosaminidase domain-containing protein [Rugamonas sp.]|uniref:glucosaminidase domain-containing protein n=1 Tax=Rugamonas sp. TaxID=1926287 RepID=UPI00345B5E5E
MPSAFGQGAGVAFASAFRQVQGDVADFISHGSTGASVSGVDTSSAQALSVQAQALRARPALAASGADSDIQQQFLASIQPWADETGQKLGVSPAIVAAHAALESGWGQRPLRAPGGADSNNLFGVKAGGQWQGAVAAATTTEYAHGAALKKTEQFRAYPDTASAFRDYADMLSNNPRYQAALHTGNDARAFAGALAQGGYATDPAYADKLSRLASKLQQQGAAASAVATQPGD